MPRGNRSKLVTAFNVAFALGFAANIGALIWVVSADQTAQSERARQHAHQYTHDARQRIAEVCRQRRGQAFAECVVETIQTTREYQRGEQDLAAQQQMANWALLLLATSMGTVAISAVGLFALLRTVRQGQEGLTLARQSNAETIRIGEAQTRAYLSVVRADIHIDRRPGGTPDFPTFDTFLHFHNSGETPAVNVSYHCRAGVSTWGEIHVLPPLETVPRQEFVTNIPPGKANEIKAACYGVARDWREVQSRWKQYTEHTPMGKAPILLIYGVVFYEDVFGHTFRSKFAFWLEEQPMKGRTIRGSDDLPTLQARIPTFERIRDRLDHIRPASEDEKCT